MHSCFDNFSQNCTKIKEIGKEDASCICQRYASFLSNRVVDLGALRVCVSPLTKFYLMSWNGVFQKIAKYRAIVPSTETVSHPFSEILDPPLQCTPIQQVRLPESRYINERIFGDVNIKCSVQFMSVYPLNSSKTFTNEYLKRKCLELMHNQLHLLPYELMAKLCNTPES